MRKTILAIVGRGHWGQVYKRTIDRMNSVVLPEHNIFGRDYKTGFKNKTESDIDGIIVAALTSAHYEIVSFLLKHGFKNLLIEKPLTQTYYQAKKLQKLLNTTSDANVMVGHTLIYDPAYNKMKDFAHKSLGNIFQIIFTSLKTPPIRNATILQDAGSPPIYLFLDFAGKNPTTISAKPKKNDNIELTLTFDTGLVATAHIGSIYPKRERGIKIIGEKGKLVLNEFVNPRELVIDNNGMKKNLTFPSNRTSLELEIQEFVNYIIDGKKPKTPYFQGIDVVRIIEHAQRSLEKKGQIIPFN